ncbi:MAG: HEAT repeat domain-containing protein, partial [bacterium]
KIRNSRATEALIAALRDDNPEVRKAVVIALAKINESRVVAALSTMLNDPDPDVADAAAQALNRAGTQGFNRIRRLLRTRP